MALIRTPTPNPRDFDGFANSRYSVVRISKIKQVAVHIMPQY